MTYKKYLSFFILVLALALSMSNGYAQVKDEITEGRDYWMAIPHCKASQDEPVRWGIYPVELWVSSKVNTVCQVTSADGTMNENHAIRANSIKVIAISDILMNKKSEVVTKKGIRITSKDPISVGVFMAYKWSGEAYRVIPIEWLGKTYVTANMYQDRTKMHSGETDDKPAQILIWATQDNTTVTYVPTAETEIGIKPGATNTVKLMKGETFLIEAKIIPALNQDWKTDLSGTYITANKPIGVISGHTKGAFPRYTASMYGIKSDFMRNMLIEMMWPVELLGKEYISAPIKYTNRPYTANVESEKGDIIRFVASEDGTNIFQMRQDGSSLKQIATNLKKGQWYDIIEQQVAAYYRSNKKVLVAQYGKSWLDHVPPPTVGKEVEDPQNPSRNGQGMMLVLAPIERWCSYATFRAPGGMDNFFYLTFKSSDLGNIKVDGEYVKAKWGSAVRAVQGTDYLYLISVIPSGDHIISAENDGRFAGYVYGNYDYTKDGFAYGYPVGINYATFCEDSLYMEDKMVCGNVTGTGFSVDLRPDTSCAGIFNILFRDQESENYEFILDSKFKVGDKQATFYLNVLDLKKYAKAKVTIISLSGKSITKEYEYIPEDVYATPSKVDFGLMQKGDKVDKSFTLHNPTKTEVTVKALKLKYNKAEFAITSKDFPCVIKAGQSRLVNVSATALKDEADVYQDIVIAELSCYEKEIDTLSFKSGEPIVWIGDANWGSIPVKVERVKSVEIINQGNVPVVLNTIEWPDKLHFTRVANLPLPLTLQKGETHEFQVFYIADVPGVKHTTKALFTGNTTKVKLYSDWEGSGVDVGPVITPYDWQRKRIDDKFAKFDDPAKGYKGSVDLSAIGNGKLINVKVTISNDPDGVFSFDSFDVPQVLQGDAAAIPLTVFFKPKAEKDYLATITLEGEFNGQVLKNSATLKGTGILPHINVGGMDWGYLMQGQKKAENVRVKHFEVFNNTYAMALTVFGLKIDGPQKNNFAIDPTWLAANTFPIKIDVGSSIDVPVIFTANDLGDNKAQLIADDDATAPADVHIGDLVAHVDKPGLMANNKDFGIIFKIAETKTDYVFATNTGTIDVKFLRDILPSQLGTDDNNFNITNWFISNNGTVKSTKPDLAKGNLVLNPKDTLWVEVLFKPDVSRKFDSYIEYLTDVDTVRSNLTGIGQEMFTLAYIPEYTTNPKTNIELHPGDPIENVEVKYGINSPKEKADKNGEEFDKIDRAKITSFKAYIHFQSPSRATIGIQDVFPVDLDLTAKTGIITQGTMTEGWKVDILDLLPKGKASYIYVEMSGTTPLKETANKTLFGVKMKTFLSNLETIPLGVEFKPINKPFVNVDTIPGKVTIKPVCVNTLRLIQITNKEYALYQVNPNPVSGNTNIQYSIGLESQVTIELFNTAGVRVSTLIDETLKPGAYELSVDVNQLGLNSGVYYYRLKSGPFEDTKSFVIQK